MDRFEEEQDCCGYYGSGEMRHPRDDRDPLVGIKLAAPAYRNASARKETFHNWPLQLAQKSYSMAEKGFVYTGLSDRVRCFCCGIYLHSWQADDDITLEHKRISPNCAFVKMTSILDDFIQ